MIIVTGYDTCRPAYVDEKCIVDITEHTETVQDRVYPYSKIHIKDDKEKHDYILEVVESKKKIERLISEAKKKPPKEKLGPEPPVDI
jgi:hypothetical protein